MENGLKKVCHRGAEGTEKGLTNVSRKGAKGQRRRVGIWEVSRRGRRKRISEFKL